MHHHAAGQHEVAFRAGLFYGLGNVIGHSHAEVACGKFKIA
jgi:hypothetical protein